MPDQSDNAYNQLVMTDTNLIKRLREMRDKYRRKTQEAKTENMRHRFKGMADAYENAIELAEVVSGKHSNPIDV